MDVLIVSPPAPVQNGNLATAEEWAAELTNLGHRVQIASTFQDQDASLLIAIHAHKSHPSVNRFHEVRPSGRIVVALAGTDLYPKLSSLSLRSLELSHRIVVLQAKALARVPASCRSKTRVINLSATAPPSSAQVEPTEHNGFQACVVGHLREVKDPLRTAAAARLLPSQSRLTVRHAGSILEEKFRNAVAVEERENPRYQWLGALSAEEALHLIAASDLLVLSSIAEGGARVLNEAVVSGTPILAARNDATISLLGDHYPGLFDPGETAALAALLHRCESEPEFLADLTRRVVQHAAECAESREQEAWKSLLDELYLEGAKHDP
jgi:putative glycosyltransferase (TIGR04348 family)